MFVELFMGGIKFVIFERWGWKMVILWVGILCWLLGIVLYLINVGKLNVVCLFNELIINLWDFLLLIIEDLL